MFLIIFEDSTFSKISEIDAELLESCTDRYCDLIDISNPDNPVYYDSKFDWVPVSTVNTPTRS